MLIISDETLRLWLLAHPIWKQLLATYPRLNQMLFGALAVAWIVASLLFARFWRMTRDRFFLFFAFAFFINGIDRIIAGLSNDGNELDALTYLIRLLTFLLIIFAIIDKNWIRKATRR